MSRGGLRRLPNKSAYVFVNERTAPFGRMGIARMVERAGAEAGTGFPVHVHMLRHACGYALGNKGMDTRRLQHYLGQHGEVQSDKPRAIQGYLAVASLR